MKIKRFFECLVPVTACNLKCSYCYIIQRNHRSMEIPKMKYSLSQIRSALTKERLGGSCYFSICGAGETMLADQIVGLVHVLLQEGHYVNITTNGTITSKFQEFECFTPDEFSRLHVSFSLHYLELIRLQKLDVFFENVQRVKQWGASILVQVNLCDEYEPYLEQIRELCMQKVGAYPQVAATRKEMDLNSKIEFLTAHTAEEYVQLGKPFCSALFDFTIRNFNQKRREFCYAGDWSGVLNFHTGILRKCYSDDQGQNIFENCEEPIHFEAIGACGSLFCMNSSHFLSLGVIPELYPDITYAALRNRSAAGWYSETMKTVLSGKLSETNETYPEEKKKTIYKAAHKKIMRKMMISNLKTAIKTVIRWDSRKAKTQQER